MTAIAAPVPFCSGLAASQLGVDNLTRSMLDRLMATQMQERQFIVVMQQMQRMKLEGDAFQFRLRAACLATKESFTRTRKQQGTPTSSPPLSPAQPSAHSSCDSSSSLSSFTSSTLLTPRRTGKKKTVSWSDVEDVAFF